ncbi:hypothetical protein DAETH_41080 (plasmid) [Deinococcus aetherius]|uniref:Uncharacterized protein n=1 Tax=Deinococcus aetherius TaxID=200252 RepID=A0ABM8AJY9_9DEIO|nr:hypothetical protein [Deinococcus aetherius]BDP44139.1 hypothetical protein DAETH_41080 [Deinococcus aetherius]
MKKLSLFTAVFILATSAAAQTSQVSGYATLIAIGQVRGIQPPLTVARLQKVQPNSAAARAISEKLRVSPAALASLLKYGNTLAPTSLVTQAVLESATGKTLFQNAVAGLIQQNPTLAVNTQQSLSSLLSDPAALAAANQAAAAAGQPVTPRGGGN